MSTIDFGTLSITRGQKFHHIPTPGPSTTSSSGNCQNTPASTTASSFPRSNSSAPSPATQTNHNPSFSHQQQNISSASNNMSSMDPFIAYDAGFYMPPGGMFEPLGQDEPLANYMSPPTSNSNTSTSPSNNTANTSAASGLNLPQSGNPSGNNAAGGWSNGFPWGMPTMDLDQDWSWFMNDVQNFNPISSQGQNTNAGLSSHPQLAVLP